ncbi:indole-3-glycerol phosphate synthase TrpC [Tumebacillus flagellatus]|uniref:Indole-3-glycerol phosphate synthase n=1 Tax=Tumebacillus flagellatus TaxID=1157490 RepID=A0A074MCZ4_9BACL|nr:indole-3-glycerol phosphate synthase TrpC [Tumebacillus flagellatus]KEO83752.1 indole-3-glycerol phosphate synthase [Tumebacillus flagellatus]
MILDRIVEVKRQEVAELAKAFNREEALAEIAKLPPTRGFADALRAASAYIGLIAEVKKASPSKGVIRPDFDPVVIAKTYEAAGASCLSVLTDEQFFQGHADYLRKIRASVNLPLLRKDFIIDEKQIYEARLIGADCVLLIAAILTTEQLREFRELASTLGLDALVEVHDEAELEQALASGATLLGVNNRDLRDFTVDLGTTARIAKLVPDGTLLVSESGIVTHDDVRAVKEAGAAAILVGETLMRDPEIAPSVDLLLGRVSQ